MAGAGAPMDQLVAGSPIAPDMAAPGDPLAAETRPLGSIVRATADACLGDLSDLAHELAGEAGSKSGGAGAAGGASKFNTGGRLDEHSRKVALLRYLHCSKQKLLRLLVLARWAKQLPIIERCRQVSSTLSNHDASLSQSADALFGLHAHLTAMRAPLYDVASAAEILSQGSYHRLPQAIEVLRQEDPEQQEASEQDQETPGLNEAGSLGSSDAVAGARLGAGSEVQTQPGADEESNLDTACGVSSLDAQVWRQLLEVPRPAQLSHVAVQGGRVTLRVDGEYEADLTLGYAYRLDMWRMLDMRFLIGRRSEGARETPAGASTADSAPFQLPALQKMGLAYDIQCRVEAECLAAEARKALAQGAGSGAQSDVAGDAQRGARGGPLGAVHEVLHTVAATLACDEILRQLKELEAMHWKDHIRVETTIPEGAHSAGPDPGASKADTPSVPGTPMDGAAPSEASLKAGERTAGAGDAGAKVQQKGLGVKVWYWITQGGPASSKGPAAAGARSGLGVEEDAAAEDEDAQPCIALDLLPASGDPRSLQEMLVCRHSPPAVDPLTGGGAHLALDPACIDVELLLQNAIRCAAHSKLVALHRSLRSCAPALCLAPSDVFLSFADSRVGASAEDDKAPHSLASGGRQKRIMAWAAPSRCRTETLWVRLLGDQVMLGFSLALRTGAFELCIPQQHHPALSQAVAEMESRLNLALASPLALTKAAGEAVRLLRYHALQQHFATLAPSCGLEPATEAALPLSPSTGGVGQDLPGFRLPPSPQSLLLSFTGPVLSQSERGLTDPSAGPSTMLAICFSPEFVPSFFLLRLSRRGPPASQDAPARVPALVPTATVPPSIQQWLHLDVGGQPLTAAERVSLGGAPTKAAEPDDAGANAAEEQDDSRHGGGLDHAAGSVDVSWAPEDGTQARTRKRASGESMPGSRLKRARVDASWEAGAFSLGELVHDACWGQGNLGPLYIALRRAVQSACLAVKQDQLTGALRALGVPFSTYDPLTTIWRESPPQGSLFGPVPGLPLQKADGSFLATSTVAFRLPNVPGSRSASNAPWQRLYANLSPPAEEAWSVLLPVPYFAGLKAMAREDEPGEQKPMVGTGEGSFWPGVAYVEADGLAGQHAWEGDALQLTYRGLSSHHVAAMTADVETLWAASLFISRLRAVMQRRLYLDPLPGASQGDRGAVGLKRAPKRQGPGHDGVRDRLRGAWAACRDLVKVAAVGLLELRLSVDVGRLMGAPSLAPVRILIRWHSGLGASATARPAGPGNRSTTAGAAHCLVNVAPPDLWPHTGFLEECIRLGDAELLLDAIRLTCGPLSALHSAIHPMRTVPIPPMLPPRPPGGPAGLPPSRPMPTLAPSPGGPGHGGMPRTAPQAFSPAMGPLLPSDVSLLQRSLLSFRLVYRNEFAIDVRCTSSDLVWMQPAPPPWHASRPRAAAAGAGSGAEDGAGNGAMWSAPCPQFRNFILEQVGPMLLQQDRASLEAQAAAACGLASSPTSAGPHEAAMAARASELLQAYQVALSMGAPPRSEMQLAVVGVSDEGGYGGAWVPVALLKRVLRSMLRYLGTIWLFSRFPSVLSTVLGPSPKAGLLSQDPEQPALRFFINNYVFMVNLHRQRRMSASGGEALHLMLQVVNARTVPQRRQGGPVQLDPETDMSPAELTELSELFSRRVAVEPFDASRLASFVTLAMLPLPLIREFLGLQALKREQLREVQAGPSRGAVAEHGALSQLVAMDLCLENRLGMGWSLDWLAGEGSGVHTARQAAGPGAEQQGPEQRSDLVLSKQPPWVEFTLLFVLDKLLHALGRSASVAGGASWLPHSVAARLRLSMVERSYSLSLVRFTGSHDGEAIWGGEGWERCEAAVSTTVAATAADPEAWQGGWLRRLVLRLQRTLMAQVQSVDRTPPKPQGPVQGKDGASPAAPRSAPAPPEPLPSSVMHSLLSRSDTEALP